MPVIVIGADTRPGRVAVAALVARQGELRAFVSDPEAATGLRRQGVKVAIGDVSDASHIGGAALNAFTAVLIEEATDDERETAFASTPADVASAWGAAAAEAGVRRLIWVGASGLPEDVAQATPEAVAIDPSSMSDEQLAAEIARLDGLRTLG
jgi:uncharacterized protein YbjT (DUF2867 family)